MDTWEFPMENKTSSLWKLVPRNRGNPEDFSEKLQNFGDLGWICVFSKKRLHWLERILLTCNCEGKQSFGGENFQVPFETIFGSTKPSHGMPKIVTGILIRWMDPETSRFHNGHFYPWDLGKPRSERKKTRREDTFEDFGISPRLLKWSNVDIKARLLAGKLSSQKIVTLGKNKQLFLRNNPSITSRYLSLSLYEYIEQ